MPAFSNVGDLKAQLLSEDPEVFFQKYVFEYDSTLYDKSKIQFCANKISENFQAQIKCEDLIVVGSAKLGFALHDKYKKGQKIGQAFRGYDKNSDIDLAICSKYIFECLWGEVARFALTKDDMPYRISKFGDYLVYGWYRSDHLKNIPKLNMRFADSLRKSRSSIRRDYINGNPRVDFGIFYSFEQMKMYQKKSITAAKRALELSL